MAACAAPSSNERRLPRASALWRALCLRCFTLAFGPRSFRWELEADPLETNDLARSEPAKLRELQAMLDAHERTAFNPHRGGNDPKACAAALGPWRGFWGPWIE